MLLGWRGGLQEDVGGLAHNPPDANGNQPRDADWEQGVCRRPPIEQDDQTSDNDSNGGSHIPKDMQRCSTHIEIVPALCRPKPMKRLTAMPIPPTGT
jgi:hypothetical protein